MKQTLERNLYYRVNTPPGTGAINGGQWQNVPPSVITQQASKRKGFPCWLLFVVVVVSWGISSIVGNRSKTAQGRAEPRQVESRAVIQSSPAVTVRRAEPIVERALPVGRVPRAEAVGSGQTIDESWLANSSNVGRWAVLTVPSEGSVWAHFRGRISSVDNLPRSAERWDWYQTPSASWIYMAPAATGRLGWMDP